MINQDKIYLMTKAAIFEKEESGKALDIVSYRRKDYILYHLIGIFASVTVAYAVLVGTVMFMIIMAYDTIILNVGEMVLIGIGVFLGYIVVLILYYMISHKYYGDKHVKARQDVRSYLVLLKQIENLEEEEGQVENHEMDVDR